MCFRCEIWTQAAVWWVIVMSPRTLIISDPAWTNSLHSTGYFYEQFKCNKLPRVDPIPSLATLHISACDSGLTRGSVKLLGWQCRKEGLDCNTISGAGRAAGRAPPAAVCWQRGDTASSVSVWLTDSCTAHISVSVIDIETQSLPRIFEKKVRGRYGWTP